ncbi:MSMEG_6728 family protein [Streptomyces sp. NBC_00083]|uniref:MSMEG_6728 family protein n=1 Tax=Streptomyces sp. NBC_00083 TaxID=2975647 RepID=UPI00225841A2|nr:MSMEG_6728 family protein [Streptomyces sp. NBC_00083]MCX5384160.1 MSMEG_6728 family protein [Streptomyces sp. NBC_00083]
MQTFLPRPGFADSAEVLDRRRLGKQRVEALQVFRGLTVPGYGWRRHPAVRMWSGYEEALVCYGLVICGAWTAQGRADTCAGTLREDYRRWRGTSGTGAVRAQEELARAGELPPWLGSPEFHRSHQSALVRKEPEFYRPLFPEVPDDLPYVWPASDRERQSGGA